MKVNNIEVYGVIYKIANDINGRVYIGRTKNGFDNRYKKGLLGKIHNKKLKKDIDIYGVDNFTVNKCLDVAFSKTELCVKERCWINLHKDNIYNEDTYDNAGDKNKNKFVRIKVRKSELYDIINLIKSNGMYVLTEK
ncbi:MAG TPA: GIY-YIG nuclease family protein [Romboutsia timonensis]|uniref:GIY-YIG nuclease family protein n=1 Tax=Romboutsia timonensis TaxID=1776391 RepID=A0A921N157_9FIRM|nr:GIY-YIG nuclease family protein [Romboutsia timonensis]